MSGAAAVAGGPRRRGRMWLPGVGGAGMSGVGVLAGGREGERRVSVGAGGPGGVADGASRNPGASR